MAVVVKDSRVLIQYRYRIDKGMVYEFPGGSMDLGESAEAAAKRELFEETGIKAEDLLAMGQYQSINEYGGNIFYVIFSTKMSVSPVVVNPERKQTFYWFHSSEIPIIDFFPADIKFIETELTPALHKVLLKFFSSDWSTRQGNPPFLIARPH